MSIGMLPLSWVYSGAIGLRNQLFDRGIMSTHHFEVPVVSVGNISVGGTGKTPMIQEIIRWCLEKNIRPGVVSRGYGGQYSDLERVELNDSDATKKFGDEPVMTKRKYPDVPFYVCRERSRAVVELTKENRVDLVLADDAFQHRALGRDLDIVMMDAGKGPDHYFLLPRGRLREPLEQLQRADFIVVTRWNLADEERRSFLTDLISKNTGPKLKATIFCDYELLNIGGLDPSEEVILFSGIGNPESFENLVKQKLKVHSHRVFKDHHSYKSGEIDELLSLGKILVTTEKDAVKLRSLNMDTSNIVVADLELKFSSEIEKLYGALDELLI